MALRPWLRLARITNLPTVVADVTGGALIAAGPYWLGMFDSVLSQASEGVKGQAGLRALGGWVPTWLALIVIAAAACCLYLAGMIDNDVQHADKDRMLNKPRPIVQGVVGFSQAAFVRTTLMLVGILLAGLSAAAVNIEMRWIASALLVLSLAIALGSRWYNKLAAGRAIEFTWHPPTKGESTMGLVLLSICRGCSMGMGVVLGVAVASHAARVQPFEVALSFPVALAIVTSIAYFFVVTRISLLEDFGGGASAIRMSGLLLTLAIWTGPIVLYVTRYEVFADERYLSECLPAFFMLLIASLAIWARLSVATRDPIPPNVGKVIGTSIAYWPMVVGGIVMLTGTANASDMSGSDRLLAGLAVSALTPLCFMLRRFGAAT